LKKPIGRLGITVGILASCGVAAGIAGCLSSTGNGSTSGSTGSSGSAAGAAGSMTGTTGATGSAAGAAGASGSSSSGVSTSGTSTVGQGSDVVLDDMLGMQSALLGSWYTYSDRTLPNSEPPLLQPGKADLGSIMPMEGAAFYPMSDTRGPTITVDGGPTLLPYREATGGGETTWGCGFGLDLQSALPDGGAVIFNSCAGFVADAGMPIFDVTNAGGNVGIPIPFNAKAAGYTGIAFYGISFGTTLISVNVQMDDERTSAWGGVCDACVNGGPPTGHDCEATDDGGMDCPCSDSYIYTAPFAAGKWERFAFHFTDMTLATANWSKQGLAKGGIDTTQLYNLHFQLSLGSAKTLPNFDIGVAYITWLTD
jgi:hypothetical protein